METLRKIGLLSIPLNFLLAGIGMLLLLKVDGASGDFFSRIANHESNWVNAHILLLVSTMLLLPASIGIRLELKHKVIGVIANGLIIIVAVTSILLAGQYVIDLIIPLLVAIGGEALKLHELLFSTPLLDILFYQLPNLAFLAMFLLTCTLFGNEKVPKKIAGLLLLVWLFVLLGNLIAPLFQRIAILLLGFTFIPFVRLSWAGHIKTQT